MEKPAKSGLGGGLGGIGFGAGGGGGGGGTKKLARMKLISNLTLRKQHYNNGLK